jgi:hypothetical protein
MYCDGAFLTARRLAASSRDALPAVPISRGCRPLAEHGNPAETKSPGVQIPGFPFPHRRQFHRSPLRELIPRSYPTRVQRSNASKSNGLPSWPPAMINIPAATSS